IRHRQRAGPPPRGSLSRAALQRRRAVRSAEASCRGQRLCLRARSGDARDPACVEYRRGRRETVRGAEGGIVVTGSDGRVATALAAPARGGRPQAKLPNPRDGCECCADPNSDLDNALVVSCLAAVAQIREFQQGSSRPYEANTFPNNGGER